MMLRQNKKEKTNMQKKSKTKQKDECHARRICKKTTKKECHNSINTLDIFDLIQNNNFYGIFFLFFFFYSCNVFFFVIAIEESAYRFVHISSCIMPTGFC